MCKVSIIIPNKKTEELIEQHPNIFIAKCTFEYEYLDETIYIYTSL